MSANVSTNPQLFQRFKFQRTWIFGAMIIAALFAFELFNYSTTEFALSDLLGDLKFIGIRWATILSIAFCGIDFAGIARLFTPQSDPGSSSMPHNETWYLFGAWLLAATMNAMLTWWGVSLAVLSHETLGNDVVARATLLRVVPIFVSILVWLIRVLIIGTFSVAGDHLFNLDNTQWANLPRQATRTATSIQPGYSGRPQTIRASMQAASGYQAAQRSNSSQVEGSFAAKPEPTYHPVNASSAASQRNGQINGSRSEPARTNPAYRS